MGLTIQQIRQNVQDGNILGINNFLGVLMEFKRKKLSNGDYAYRVVNAYAKSHSSDYYVTRDDLRGLLYHSSNVTLFDEYMRPYTQTTHGRIMHTIDPNTLIDGGFHSYSRNN